MRRLSRPQLVGETPGQDDLEDIDKLCLQALNEIRNIKEADFKDTIQDTFTTHLSDRSVVELCPGGRDIPVTFENRHQYCDLVLQARLEEGKLQARALRKGFNQVVPMGMLSLFSWHEVEILVCGSPEIDIDMLKRHTVYRGNYSAGHVVMKNLFQALRSFSQEERRLFLR